MKVKEILARYPAGTLLALWGRTFGGPSHLGTFMVDERAVVYLGTLRKWGEIGREIARNNKSRRLVVTEVKAFPNLSPAPTRNYASGTAVPPAPRGGRRQL
ncbi:MAG: hypothetical protein M0Z41_10720 [Peptococcaceae bacterium]|jgi:hypothetical protein|nr:hypothetical protein [Peptococcaceae bacterium]